MAQAVSKFLRLKQGGQTVLQVEGKGSCWHPCLTPHHVTLESPSSKPLLQAFFFVWSKLKVP